MRVCVVGTGEWGRALAHVLAGNGHSVTNIGRADFNLLKRETFDAAFLVIKTEGLEAFIRDYGRFLPAIICSCAKGIFSTKLPFFSDYKEGLVVLSGPNFATEVLAGCKTITTVASRNPDNAELISSLLSAENFTVEKSFDIRALEVFGVFKNIIGIASGMMSARLDSENTKSFIFTRLIQEMIDFATRIGCKPETFFKSCGIGDIFLTACSPKSRNFSYGFKAMKEGISEPAGTVEGLRSIAALTILEAVSGFQFHYYRGLYEFLIEEKSHEAFFSRF